MVEVMVALAAKRKGEKEIGVGGEDMIVERKEKRIVERTMQVKERKAG